MPDMIPLEAILPAVDVDQLLDRLEDQGSAQDYYLLNHCGTAKQELELEMSRVLMRFLHSRGIQVGCPAGMTAIPSAVRSAIAAHEAEAESEIGMEHESEAA